MIQIRIHGRGGQGVVTAAEIIAIAAFSDGKEAQAFPSFGVERTGAPVESYARINDTFIRNREQVYNPDVLIIQDETLLNNPAILNGITPKTKIIINTPKKKEEIKISIKPVNIFVIDASKIAMETIGKNIMNTVVLGAFAKATKLVSLDSLKSAIHDKLIAKGEDIVNKNIKAIEKAYEIA